MQPNPNDEAIKTLAKEEHAYIMPATKPLIKALNAKFAPRIYVYGTDSRPIWLQAEPKDWEEAVKDYDKFEKNRNK